MCHCECVIRTSALPKVNGIVHHTHLLPLIIILQITGEGDKLRMSHDFKCHYYLNEGFHLKVKLGRTLLFIYLQSSTN